jgi:hypothetical protein
VSTIDRIRYYDGEFLRAFDFSDEQTYHVEMRRRLNRYLHLCGIVHGLTMVSPPDSYGVCIEPGMAIDDLGREIYVYAPYTLGDSDVTRNRITSAGKYDVWLRYQKSAETPPSSGYADCNQTNQYTRWVESFAVTLLSNPSTPFTPPKFADADSDDPSQDQVGVLLGTVWVDPAAVKTFKTPQFDSSRCTMLGVIAQTIQTPASWHSRKPDPPFSFQNQNTPGVVNTPLGPPASLEIKPNIFADQNLIVGPDFPLTPLPGGPNITLSTPTSVTDPGNGSVKIAGDLFVQGNIYNAITSSWKTPPAPPSPFPPAGNDQLWLEIGAYVTSLVQQQLPEFVVAVPVPVPVLSSTPVSGSYASASTQITASTKNIKNVSSAVAIPYISQVQTNSQTGFNNAFATAAVQLAITTTSNPVYSGQNVSVQVSWMAGPVQPATATSSFNTAISNFTISCLLICFP